jgi:hypothetical protein
MIIQSIDNFELNTNKAIDNRWIVGSGYHYNSKEDIEYKYEGLRVWDINQNKEYIYSEGSWLEESASDLSGGGTVNYITKFTSPNTIGNSVIRESNGNIGVDKSPSYKLDVNGNLKADGFIGNGNNITNINADNITNGVLSTNRITPGSNGDYLISNQGWGIPSGLGTTIESDEINFSVSNFDYRPVLFIDTSNNSGYDEVSYNYNNLRYDSNNNKFYTKSLTVDGSVYDSDFSLTSKNIQCDDNVIIDNISLKKQILSLGSNSGYNLIVYKEGSRVFIEGEIRGIIGNITSGNIQVVNDTFNLPTPFSHPILGNINIPAPITGTIQPEFRPKYDVYFSIPVRIVGEKTTYGYVSIETNGSFSFMNFYEFDNYIPNNGEELVINFSDISYTLFESSGFSQIGNGNTGGNTN